MYNRAYAPGKKKGTSHGVPFCCVIEKALGFPGMDNYKKSIKSQDVVLYKKTKENKSIIEIMRENKRNSSIKQVAMKRIYS